MPPGACCSDCTRSAGVAQAGKDVHATIEWHGPYGISIEIRWLSLESALTVVEALKEAQIAADRSSFCSSEGFIPGDRDDDVAADLCQFPFPASARERGTCIATMDACPRNPLCAGLPPVDANRRRWYPAHRGMT